VSKTIDVLREFRRGGGVSGGEGGVVAEVACFDCAIWVPAAEVYEAEAVMTTELDGVDGRADLAADVFVEVYGG